MISFFDRAACFACAVLLVAVSPRLLADDAVFPGEHWQQKSPAELGLDSARLDAVADALGGRGAIIKDGYVVKSWGSQSERGDWYSSAKPVLSTLLLFAVQEGKVRSLDAPIADFGWPLAEKHRSMTFRHLGAMTSGYARPEPSGAAWAYNDYAIQLYQQTLFDRVFKQSPAEVASAPDRFGALQLEDGLSFRAKNRRISASVRDMARIAWLWLNKGSWNSRQLIRRDLMDECQKPQVPGDLPLSAVAPTDDYLKIGTYGGESNHFSEAGPGIYGFNWWFNAALSGSRAALTWPDAPGDTFMSVGLRGNCTAMMPALGLVAVVAEGDWGKIEPGRRESVMNQRLRLIAHAGERVSTAPDGSADANKPAPLAADTVIVSTQRKLWHNVSLTFRGPLASETSSPNPFRDYRLDVSFVHESASPGDPPAVVPGYFAADGQAAQTGAEAGDRWRVNFVPGEIGEWSWRVSFRKGTDVAISDGPTAGEAILPDGLSGKLVIDGNIGDAPGFLGEGRLKYVGDRYLRFAGSGRTFLKSGADSPENLLAFADFDGTKPTHRFGPHMLDARPDDPVWRGGRGRNLLGAMNYLASKGVNSVYFLTMNVKGDGKDVWPWTAPEERSRFDCSKLDQWEILFSHLDRLGIAMHVVTQEQENDQLLDGGELGPQRRLYYRELVARFAHHLAVVWNLGEENTNTTDQLKAFSQHLHQLDPYDNPIVVHTFPKQQDKVYQPLLGWKFLEGASLQTNQAREQTRRWIERSAAAGRRWFVCLDEIGPADTGVKPDAVDYNHDGVRREHLWPHFMSGGAGVEWLFGYAYPHHDLSLEDFRSRDHLWDLTRYAVEFFEKQLPNKGGVYDELTPRDDDYCLAQPGEFYAIYLPRWQPTEIDLAQGTYQVRWYNPRAGGPLRRGSVECIERRGRHSIGAPPHETDQDWVCLIVIAR